MIHVSLLTEDFERCENCKSFINDEMEEIIKMLGFGFCTNEEAFSIHKYPVIQKKFHCVKFSPIS